MQSNEYIQLRNKKTRIDKDVETLPRPWLYTFFVFSLLALLISIHYIFNIEIFGKILIKNQYIYILLALYFSPCFLLYTAKCEKRTAKVPWYDITLFGVSLIIAGYFAMKAMPILNEGWSFEAPAIPTFFSIVYWILILEATRRTSGIVLFLLCTFLSLYPLFAGHMPGFLYGNALTFLETARIHSMGAEGALGIPLTVVGTILIGFLLFGVALQILGGGDFFISLAESLVGQTRGGTAKISILASGFFGSMSGSVISNVVTTGSFTIPAMKKSGFKPEFAGGVETCASSGGVLMPPVMGAAAFIMASFMNTTYLSICAAAALPSILYYISLLLHVDAYAAKKDLAGLSSEEVPKFAKIIGKGWPYLLSITALMYFLFLRWEAMAPFYAMIVMVLGTSFNKNTRLNFNKFFNFFIDGGRLMVYITCLMAGIGLILGALSLTGTAYAFSAELIHLVGENIPALLIIGAVTSFLLGMGMTLSACYIFLAILLVPALEILGLDRMALHFFVMYWGMISFITPPVAIGAYAASGIAQSDPIKTGFESMKIGSVKYILPFAFVLNPALILHGSAVDILYSAITGLIGIIFIVGGVEGYMWFVTKKVDILSRIGLFFSGLLIFSPWFQIKICGAVLVIIVILLLKLKASRIISPERIS